MNANLQMLLDDLDRAETLGADQRVVCARRTQWLISATDEDVAELLAALLQRSPPKAGSATDKLLSTALSQLVQRQRVARQSTSAQAAGLVGTHSHITLLHQHLGQGSQARSQLLAMLSTAGQQRGLVEFADLIATDPPPLANDVAIVFAPLFQRKDYDPSALFPRLLDGLAHPSVAGAILDLANFVAREQLMPHHPAAQRTAQLVALLGGVVERLGRLEERPDESGDAPHKLSEMISESVALAVSLCDALGLIGDRSVTGKLYQTLELSHRRLRAEAAAALAKLGEEAGVEALVQLAAEPVARLRVLAYAEELGVLDRIEPQFASPVARAEAELALALSEPTLMGLPPSRCELFDQRTQFWPGYDEPIDCYLFRYTYQLGQSLYSNIGIAGPLAYTFTADMADLPPDDIYAAFAGWQAEHEEIQEQEVAGLSDAQRIEVARLQRRLRDAAYDDIEPLTLGSFFGQRVLVAAARREGAAGLAVVDANDIYWYPARKSLRPLGPREAYCIYKGRKLLRTFNP
jgi:hypothetical protein